MKIKKNIFINFSNKFIFYLLGLLGFTTSLNIMCTKEYGVPNADFVINGTIKSQTTSQIIQKIQVITTTDENSWIKDTVYTDSQGKFVTRINEFPLKQTFILKINDIDGSNNGTYTSKDTSITFDNLNFSGGNGHWYKGKTEKNITIYLVPKN